MPFRIIIISHVRICLSAPKFDRCVTKSWRWFFRDDSLENKYYDVAKRMQKLIAETKIFRDFTLNRRNNRGLWPRGIIGKYHQPSNANRVRWLPRMCVQTALIRKLAMSSKTEIVMTWFERKDLWPRLWQITKARNYIKPRW